MISGKVAHNSQDYWGQGAIRQTAEGKDKLCTGSNKLVAIGVHKGLSLSLGEHKGLSSCQIVTMLSRFIMCHTCHVTHVTLCDVCDNILSHI